MKYFNKEGKEVKVGDYVTSVEKISSPYGEVESTIKIKITEKNLIDLVNIDFLTVKNDDAVITPKDFIEGYANTLNHSTSAIKLIIRNSYKMFPNDVFAGILKKVAIKLDKKYSNPIPESNECWFIDKLTHEAFKTKNDFLKYYKYKCIFRSKEDAELGVKITEDIIKYCNE